MPLLWKYTWPQFNPRREEPARKVLEVQSRHIENEHFTIPPSKQTKVSYRAITVATLTKRQK